MVAIAAASDSVSPPNVPEKKMSSIRRMISARPDHRRDRHAVAHRLAEACEIGRHPVARLRAADRPAEAGDDFVEDQQRAVAMREFLQPLEIAGRRLGRVHRLQDDGGELAGVLA